MTGNKKVNIHPYTDIFVRYLLGDEKNTDLLLSFINAVNEDTDLPGIKSVTVKNPYNLKKLAKEKETILDIKATDEFGEVYNIEIQAAGDETFKHRALYYWAKLYSSQIETGEKYFELKPTITINLLNFNLIESKEVHSCFGIFEKSNHELMLSNHLLIHFIELPKFIKESKFNNEFEKWLAFFKYEGTREDIMQVVVDNSDLLTKAHKRFKTFTKNDELVELYEARQKYQMDRDTAIGYAEMKGIEKGIEQGEKKGSYEKAIATASVLKKAGIAIELISESTGLTAGDIDKL